MIDCSGYAKYVLQQVADLRLTKSEVCWAAVKEGVDTCSQRWRETSEEKRDIERLQADMVNDVRRAAEVHRQVTNMTPPESLCDPATLDLEPMSCNT